MRRWLATEGSRRFAEWALLPILAAVVLAVHGYHPWAEDGGLYAAGVRLLLHPGLYGGSAPFLLVHARWSIFAHLVALLVVLSRQPLEWVLFALQLAAAGLYLAAARRLAAALGYSRRARVGTMLLAAAWFTLPVAGTALFLMEPYVTARSFSTPSLLFALAAAVEGRGRAALAWLAAAAVVHPLMAAYGGSLLLCLLLAQSEAKRLPGWRLVAMTAAGALLAAGALALLTRGGGEATAAAEASRRYFYLSEWTWYEIAGLLAPLALLLAAARHRRTPVRVRQLALAAAACGTAALLCSALFVHRGGNLLLARLQPLRAFHLLYAAGVVMLSTSVAEQLMRKAAQSPRSAVRVIAASSAGLIVLALFAGMAVVERRTFPASRRVEWPWAAPVNPWTQAFVWVRWHTPPSVLFAVDPYYTGLPNEEAINFRAVAERGILADYLKDGGVAAVAPAVAPKWQREVDLQRGLNGWTDEQRTERLKAAGANWLLLSPAAETRLPCPYQNAAVSVCSLP